MIRPDDEIMIQLARIRDETGNDDWRERTRAVLHIACAMADDWTPSDQPWYVWMQEHLDAIYGEIEKPGGGPIK